MSKKLMLVALMLGLAIVPWNAALTSDERSPGRTAGRDSNAGAAASERELTVMVFADAATLDVVKTAGGGPFYVGGTLEDPETHEPIGFFHSWGFFFKDGTLRVMNQEYDLAGRGKIVLAGVEGKGRSAITGGTGIFKNVRGQASGIDLSNSPFPVTFELIGAERSAALDPEDGRDRQDGSGFVEKNGDPCGNGFCAGVGDGEDCNLCPTDCPSGTTSGAACGDGLCEAGDGEDCVSCPADCNGVQSGKPSNRFCCGDGDGQNPLPCSDAVCSTGGWQCTDAPQLPTSYCCGDLTCDSGEDCANCPLDCSTGAEVCDDGIDNDCDESADCDDQDCDGHPACSEEPTDECNGGTDTLICHHRNVRKTEILCVGPEDNAEALAEHMEHGDNIVGDEVCDGVDNDCDGVVDNGGNALCDDGNVCTDDVCDGVNGCEYTNNTDPCDDATVCNGNEVCGGGTCNDGTPLDCDDGNVCTDNSCDSVMGCVTSNNTASCGDGSDTECTNPDSCDGAGECLDNHETGGTTVTCGSAGTECTNQDYCAGDGTCTDSGFQPTTTSCDDGSDTECTNPDSCDGAGVCLDNHEAGGDTVTCGDTGTECTNQDYCAGDGMCANKGFPAAGALCGEGSDTECSNPDSCNGAGLCLDNHETGGDTVTCGDAGTECTNQDYCAGDGTCADKGFPAAGALCGNGSDTECTNPDSCNGAGECLDNHETGGATATCGSAGTECTNQDYCAGDGTCTDNAFKSDTTACTDTTADCSSAECNGSGACDQQGGFETSGFACGSPSDTACDDPDSCDGAGACQVNNIAGNCGDTGAECTNQDVCEDGLCQDKGFKSDTTACTDTTADCSSAECNGSGACDQQGGFETSGLTCGSPSDTVCDDPDSCDGAGACQVNNIAGNCGDTGTECTNQDVCVAGLCQDNGFQSNTTECTDTKADCFSAKCNDSGACDQRGGFETSGFACGSPSNTACDDPDSCDAAGTCEANPSLPINCEVSGWSAWGACSAACGGGTQTRTRTVTVPAQCGGTSCPSVTETQACNQGACDLCAGETCDDNNACTNDSCNPATGCVFTNNTAACTDTTADCYSAKCNGSGVCDQQGGFEPEGISCGDQSATVCNSRDTCDGLGACDPNSLDGATFCDTNDACSICVVDNAGVDTCVSRAGNTCSSDSDVCTLQKFELTETGLGCVCVLQDGGNRSCTDFCIDTNNDSCRRSSDGCACQPSTLGPTGRALHCARNEFYECPAD